MIAPVQGFDDATVELVRRKADRVARKLGLGHHDAEDFSQILATKVWKAIQSYDSRRGRFDVYVNVVAERCSRSLLRDYGRLPRLRSLSRKVSDGDGRAVDHAQQIAGEPSRRVDLELDVETLLEELPDDDREEFEHVMHDSISQAAMTLGIPRSTLVDRLRRYRQRFEDGNLHEYLPAVRQSDRRPGIR